VLGHISQAIGYFAHLVNAEVSSDDRAGREPKVLFALELSVGTQVDNAELVVLRQKDQRRGVVGAESATSSAIFKIESQTSPSTSKGKICSVTGTKMSLQRRL